MKKFEFNLESLLVMREWEERRTRQALSEATACVARLREHMSFLESEKSRAFESWKDAGSRSFTASDRLNMNSQVTNLDSRVLESQQRLREATAEREKAMEALSVATRRKRAVESLREKRFQEHSAEVIRQESIEIEDIFNARRAITT